MKLAQLEVGKEYAWVTRPSWHSATKIKITPEQLTQGANPRTASPYIRANGKIEVLAYEMDYFTRSWGWVKDYAPLGQIAMTWEEWEEAEKLRQKAEEQARLDRYEAEQNRQKVRAELLEFIELNRSEIEALIGSPYVPFNGTKVQVTLGVKDLERLLELFNSKAVTA